MSCSGEGCCICVVVVCILGLLERDLCVVSTVVAYRDVIGCDFIRCCQVGCVLIDGGANLHG